MKLIDLLVRELPKRGGWPEGAICVVQSFVDGELYFYDKPYDASGAMRKNIGRYTIPKASDVKMNDFGLPPSISKCQYQSALAASQKPAWNGEGLPPVRCECEWRDTNVGWLPVTIKYISEQIVVMASPTNLCGVRELTEIAKDIICDKPQFRPLRTETDKKRDDAVSKMFYALPPDKVPGKDIREAIYDAIAAGKIPGVKLED